MIIPSNTSMSSNPGTAGDLSKQVSFQIWRKRILCRENELMSITTKLLKLKIRRPDYCKFDE